MRSPDRVDLIVSQGRIGDRSTGPIAGAARIAGALRERHGWRPSVCGSPDGNTTRDWSTSLSQARGTLTALAGALAGCLGRGGFPVVVANTCSASLATLPVVLRRHPEAVVLWIDAHADFNTPSTTATGYLGGMVLAGACGLWDSGHGAGLSPERIVLVGARDIDAEEADLLRRMGVRVMPPGLVTPGGVLEAADGAKVWIHIDWDVLEPGSVPADYRCPGGLRPEQLRAVLAAVPPESVIGLEVAEYSPDEGGSHPDAVGAIVGILAPLLGDPA